MPDVAVESDLNYDKLSIAARFSMPRRQHQRQPRALKMLGRCVERVLRWIIASQAKLARRASARWCGSSLDGRSRQNGAKAGYNAAKNRSERV